MGMVQEAWSTGNNAFAETKPTSRPLAHISHLTQTAVWRAPATHHTIYNWTGPPLTTWNFPTGNAAGLYEFLIGGPIIPLVATLGINNKITFLEKFGTEPANNSTGAYELDLASLNNYTQAWRPMHVKTDVFCSASLTLPDKVGRQINIGGWANGATYGVRLYWPDGSPGVWGVNDWQENFNEVSLQIGRWYPTAMIMANGNRISPISHESSFSLPPLQAPFSWSAAKKARMVHLFHHWRLYQNLLV
jgi:hypothetical protein